MTETLIPPAAESDSQTLELDELWSFVQKKSKKVWVWLALCRVTRQIVGYALGPRDEATCRILWQSIPAQYRRGRVYSDFWAAYQKVIPKRQHRAVGKETGQTSHIERFNNTLRQRLSRFVRKTLSFSKSMLMHQLCLHLFLWQYNDGIRRRWHAGPRGVKRFRPTRTQPIA